MNYEQKYKEAKRLYETANADQRYVLESLFPELNESYDEKIRKELIEHIKANQGADYVLFKKFSPDDVIAWLEKQGEQTQLDYEHADIPQKDFAPIEHKTLNADDVIEWLVANISNYEYYVEWFKKDFGL